MSKLKISSYFSNEERKLLMKKSNIRGIVEILKTWLWIAFAFALAGIYPNVFTIIVALVIIGAKQLACAIIMHDASHYAIFKQKWLNDFLGSWFGAYPILNSVYRYRPYHYEHHIKTGHDDDPDISLTLGYPTTLKSMFRKIGRDVFGPTGLKSFLGLILMHLGILRYTLSRDVRREEYVDLKRMIKGFFNYLLGPLISNGIMFVIFWLLGKPWLYLLWIGAFLTTFNFVLRIRSIAEHSVVPDKKDKFRNSRTTYANFFERLLFAPHYVNYHLEHHLMMSVPSYNLPKMHKILLAKGFYDQKDIPLENNYWDIFKMAASLK
ncbi:MAG: fatty acid desaturase family protein [Flavobacteriales bacterium]|nr:fatty acid desaturase family protein [Flavobacteriales bacterium]